VGEWRHAAASRAYAYHEPHRFDCFRTCFNAERPHEALGQQPPASWYGDSARPYPRRLPALEYDRGVDVRRANTAGQISWRGHLIIVTSVLAGQAVGLEIATPER